MWETTHILVAVPQRRGVATSLYLRSKTRLEELSGRWASAHNEEDTMDGNIPIRMYAPFRRRAQKVSDPCWRKGREVVRQQRAATGEESG